MDGYKAYASGTRHRRATYIVVADGAERREVAGRRSLGDLRPIRDGDVWANIARNLSRQPEQEGALAFLERAHGVRRRATMTMQAGLQAAEQRAADGQPATTLAARMEDRRVAARVGVATLQLGLWAGQQAAALDGLARLAPAVRDAAARAVASL